MGCLLVSGLTKDCQFFLGGITDLIVGNYSEISGVTSSSGSSVLDTVTFYNSEHLYRLEFEKNTGSFLNEMTLSNNQRSVKQAFSFSLAKKDADTVAVAEELALGKVIAWARDRNGKWFVLGRNNGLESEVVSLNSGAAEGDFGGLIVTMTGAEISYAAEWDNGIHPLDPTYL